MDAGKQALRLMPRQGKVAVRRIRAVEGASVPAMAEADRRQAAPTSHPDGCGCFIGLWCRCANAA